MVLGFIEDRDNGKKPFNPVIGETHMCWVEHEKNDVSEFVSEQVSHHPPVSAFAVHNAKHGIEMEGSVSFVVKLSTNSASVSTNGSVVVKTSKDRVELTKCFPDLSICNTVMPGKKYIMWNGTVNLDCPESGYCATLKAEEKHGKINALSGTVFHKDDPSKIVYKLEGVCGLETHYWSPDSPNDTKTLIDNTSLEEAYIQYLPGNLRPDLDSLRLWVPVANAIIKNNMDDADVEKKKIEADQRIRYHEKNNNGKKDEGTYFQKESDGKWIYKNNLSLIELVGMNQNQSKADEIRESKRIRHSSRKKSTRNKMKVNRPAQDLPAAVEESVVPDKDTIE